MDVDDDRAAVLEAPAIKPALRHMCSMADRINLVVEEIEISGWLVAERRAFSQQRRWLSHATPTQASKQHHQPIPSIPLRTQQPFANVAFARQIEHFPS